MHAYRLLSSVGDCQLLLSSSSSPSSPSLLLLLFYYFVVRERPNCRICKQVLSLHSACTLVVYLIWAVYNFLLLPISMHMKVSYPFSSLYIHTTYSSGLPKTLPVNSEYNTTAVQSKNVHQIFTRQDTDS